MSKGCNHPNHVWTVETKCDTLIPGLDLILGRRCVCGLRMIVDTCYETLDGDVLRAVSIYSEEATKFIKAHPALKKW